MVKILAIIAVLFIIYLLFFRTKRVDNQKINSDTKKRKDSELEEVMVECCKCSTFVSTKDAIIKDGKFYCSKECANIK